MKDYNTVVLAKAKKVMGDETNNNVTSKRTENVNNRVNKTGNIMKDYNTIILAKAKNVMRDCKIAVLSSK